MQTNTYKLTSHPLDHSWGRINSPQVSEGSMEIVQIRWRGESALKKRRSVKYPQGLLVYQRAWPAVCLAAYEHQQKHTRICKTIS